MTATAASVARGAPAAPATGPFILGPALDFVLFVGTPLLILPAILAAEAFWPATTLNAFVLAFGALGHHLPGMMRAYGDSDLFRRFRVRFIVAPLFLVATCVAFMHAAPSALQLVVYAWGVWHGLMQTHGFLRIYDAKVGSTAMTTARLDHWMCLSWFAAIIVHSPTRLYAILDLFYATGGPAVPASLIAALRTATAVMAGAVTIAYVVNAVLAARKNQPASPLKHLLLITSVGFFAYANIAVPNILIGIILFEIFHDIQYLSIVWIFNRKIVTQGRAQDAFTRFVFRPRMVLVVLYVALVFAYGSLNFVHSALGDPTVATVLGGVLVASALLHFYYDGFIWKLRETGTRGALGLAAEKGASSDARRAPPWAIHAGKWALFVVPLGILAALASGPSVQDEARRIALGRSLPEHGLAQFNMGIVLSSRGELEDAVAANRRAWAARSGFDPADRAKFRGNLGGSLMQLAEHRRSMGDLAGADAALDEARALQDASP